MMRRLWLTLVMVATSVVVLLAVSASDNFNRANDSTGLGSNWTCAAGSDHFNVDTNQARDNPSATHNDVWCYYATSAATFAADQSSQAKLYGFGTSSAIAMVGVRMAGTNYTDATGYVGAINNSSTWTIYKYTGTDTYSSLNTGSLTAADGDTIYLQIVGTTLTMKQNGTTLGTATDGSYSSGQPGIQAQDPVVGGIIKADDWQGADVSAGTTFPAAILRPLFRCCRN